MVLVKLTKRSSVRKNFTLISEDEYGYNIECVGINDFKIFNNVQKIEWFKYGEAVYLTPDNAKSCHDMTSYLKVYIRKARSIENEEVIERTQSEDGKIYFGFTEKEFEDCRRGLHLAMTHLDATANGPDKLLSDRLEKIFNRMSDH